jgi:uncharacterized protein
VNSKLVGLLVGAGFGFVIAWAGVTDPKIIRNMLLLREPDVFLLMGSAVVIAGAGVRLLRAWRVRALVTQEPIAWSVSSVQSRHIAGSALFGVGWSVACTCPGPVAAMIGQGHVAGLVVAAGLVSGIAIRRRFDPRTQAAAAQPTQAAGL